MSTFKLTIETDSAAFGDPDKSAAETARLLRYVASVVECGSRLAPVLDINGNTVGSWVLS
jgi:hypothetical protein